MTTSTNTSKVSWTQKPSQENRQRSWQKKCVKRGGKIWQQSNDKIVKKNQQHESQIDMDVAMDENNHKVLSSAVYLCIHKVICTGNTIENWFYVIVILNYNLTWFNVHLAERVNVICD